jgi:sugar lactone lactonase YvrE
VTVARRRFAPLGLLLAALAATGCDRLDHRAMVLVEDPAYRAEVLLSQKDGITSPDGLRWESGRLYIADEGGSAVRLWSPGKAVETLATARDGLRSPEDLARGADGALYVTDDDAGGVWRIGAAGGAAHVVAPRGPLASTEALALAPSGALLVGGGEAGRIAAVSPQGKAVLLPLRIAKPESFAFDAAGNLYIADNEEDVLYLVTADGRLRRPIAQREGFSPETLHFSGGVLFVTDSANGKLHRYSPEDGLTTFAVFAGELANLQGITSDDAGSLYVSVQSDLKGGRGYILRLSRGTRP